MSRSLGAFVEFDRASLQRLAKIPEEMIDRVKDMTPVMVLIATDLKADMISHLETHGEGEWPQKSQATIDRHGDTPLGVGEHGGFIPTVQRSWSPRNAVAFTRAPHAHLFSGGTKRHQSTTGERVNVFNENRRHVSRPESRRRLQATVAVEHQPPRPFDYIDEETEQRSERRLAAFLVDEEFHGSI
jgi:hypothetical protein